MHTPVTRNIRNIVIVPNVSRRVAPSADRAGALAAEPSQRAERGVLVELLGAVVGSERQREVVMPDVAAGHVA